MSVACCCLGSCTRVSGEKKNQHVTKKHTPSASTKNCSIKNTAVQKSNRGEDKKQESTICVYIYMYVDM